MKKNLLISLAVGSLILAGCTKKWLTDAQQACADAIQQYLATTNAAVQDTPVKDGDLVTVDYIGRTSDSEIFDTSVKSVAEGCNSVTQGRNYDEWLQFVVGAKKMIPWFEKAVLDMKVGETKTVVLPPEDAYGERSDKNLVQMKRSDLPTGDWKKWDELPTFFGPMPITDATEDTVTIDTNPPLAWKTLTFDITVKNIQAADTVAVPDAAAVEQDINTEDTPTEETAN